jgi:hypothetical protein
VGDHLSHVTFQYSLLSSKQKMSFINSLDIIDVTAALSDLPTVSDSGRANFKYFQPTILLTKQ